MGWFVYSGQCSIIYQTQVSQLQSLPIPRPALCPLGGIAYNGYGPGQGDPVDYYGFSGEIGACGIQG